MATILIVEDEPKMRRLLEISLGEEGHSVRCVGDAETALKGLAREPADLVVTDLKLPGMSGLDFLQEAKRMSASTPMIVMTAYGTVETAVEAMKAGASDYVLKPFTMAEMKLVISKELDVQRVRDENRSLKEELGKRYHFQNIVARSRKMQEVLALVERVAGTNSTVLIGGESGVGKDLIARAIHQNSRRASGPFIKINSTAIPDNLFESELFGFEKGEFTGAMAAKPGKFELADKGSLFLDEIGDVPAPIQVKLLRVLQEREFERLGGTRTLKVDVRLIAATNRDLRAALEEGTFREDLYYRLNVVHLDIPPLRDRPQDIPRLLNHFIDKYGRRYGWTAQDLSPEIVSKFLSYDWPGNIRELENLVRRLMVLRDPNYVLAELTNRPPAQGGNAPSPTAQPPAAAGGDEEPKEYTADLKAIARKAAQVAEREAILTMLAHTAGNKREAAERLGISYKAILYKIREYGIGRPRAARKTQPPPVKEPEAPVVASDTVEESAPTVAPLEETARTSIG